MSSLILSAPISAITGGNTADNELMLGKFGQKSKVLVTVTPESGPILFAMNESSAAGTSVAAGSSLQFQMNDGDVLHFTQTAADDYFSVAVADLDSNISLPASQGLGQSVSSIAASNGLTKTGSDVKLGGTLTSSTTIANAGNTFAVTGSGFINLTSSGGALRLRDGSSGGVYIESFGLTADVFINADRRIYIVGQTYAELSGGKGSLVHKEDGVTELRIRDAGLTTRVLLEFSETLARFTDSRVLPKGLEYNADYSANFTTRSLVDKAYVTAAVSDVRLKENITSLESSTEKILSLRPVEFDFISSKEHEVGFIAQEVQQVFPEMIVSDDGEYLKIKRFDLIPHLVKTIQELEARIKVLESKYNV